MSLFRNLQAAVANDELELWAADQARSEERKARERTVTALEKIASYRPNNTKGTLP